MYTSPENPGKLIQNDQDGAGDAKRVQGVSLGRQGSRGVLVRRLLSTLGVAAVTGISTGVQAHTAVSQ